MKRNFAIIFVIVLVIIVIGVALYMFYPKPKTSSGTPKTSVQNELAVKQDKTPIAEDFPDANYEANGKWYGLCKKQSVHSINDFRKTVSSDPVLKAHFANFNWDNAQMGRLEKSMRAYVDYRKNDTIFRKKTPIVLPAGDEYITDGHIMVRTNCCNSYYAPLNELDAEPAAGPEQLQITPPTNPLLPEPIQTSALAPPPIIPTSTPGGGSSIPLSPPVYPPPGYDPPKEEPPSTVPIPAAAWIFGTGLAVLIGLRRKYKK